MRWVILLIVFALPAAAQNAQEAELAKSTLAGLQSLSFAKHSEYCGYIGLNARGEWVATRAVKGTRDRCSAPFPNDIAVTASYHTHGAFDRNYFNELPSDIDVNGDHAFFMDGYVATPGGRLWFIDGREKSVRQLCGAGCLPVAPGFFKGESGPIAEQYTYEELLRRLGN